MDTIWPDCRYALHRLARSPFFAVVVVLTLAVGIAATTIMFSIADPVLFRSLPYPDAGRLVWISHGVPGFPQGGATFSYPAYRDILEQNTSFETVAGYQGWGSLVLTGHGDAVRVVVNCVTPSYLTLLGARTQVGRLMRPEEDRFGSGDAVAVLSNGFWQRQFGGDPGVIGTTIHLNDKPFLVVGVTAADFRDAPNEEEHHEEMDAWIPLGLGYEMTAVAGATDRGGSSVWALGLMKPGVTLAQARDDLAAINQHLASTYPQTDVGYTLVPRALKDYLLGTLFSPTRILLVASCCLLLIGCANVANLLFARLLARRRELAVRAALGASAQRLSRHLLIENAMLTAGAGAAGFALAHWGMTVFRAWAPLHLPPVHLQAGLQVFLASLGVSLITGVLFGVVPALLASRVNIEETLRQGGRQGQGLTRHRGQRLLVVAEVSLALVVLVAAGMLVASFRRLEATPLGFDTSNLLTLRLQLPIAHYADPASQARFGRLLHDKLQTLPGVKSATLWGPSMLGRARNAYIAWPEGASADDPSARLLMDRHSVTPGALANLGIPLLRGRDLSWQDDANSPAVAIISEGVANTLWPGKDPIGKRMRSASGGFTAWVTVIGVARDSRQAQRFDLNEVSNGIVPTGLGPQFDAYFSSLQRPNSRVTVALRVSTDIAAVSHALKDAVLSIDPAMPVFDLAMLDDRLAAQLAPSRLVALISSVYAAAALFLAAFGLFAVLAHDVSQRVHEMGVRLALGAQRRNVLTLVLREGIALTSAGLLVGVGLGLEVSAMIENFLFGVSPSDPTIYASIAGLLLIVALVACWIPARRATRVDLLAILRGD